MPEIQPIRPAFKLQILSTSQLAEIKAATLHILEHTGVKFPSERARQVFTEHGAQVDAQSQIVRLPPDLVLEAMGRAPRNYLLSGRAEGTDLLLDGTTSYFCTDGCGTLCDFQRNCRIEKNGHGLHERVPSVSKSSISAEKCYILKCNCRAEKRVWAR
jgi:trimethylamine:corrinoid methyltransferase-like protein